MSEKLFFMFYLSYVITHFQGEQKSFYNIFPENIDVVKFFLSKNKTINMSFCLFYKCFSLNKIREELIKNNYTQEFFGNKSRPNWYKYNHGTKSEIMYKKYLYNTFYKTFYYLLRGDPDSTYGIIFIEADIIGNL